ncbi:uncharacterized protein CMU_000160 [Cryptosporidium muris RN66]|uniref:Uncharacterized protein n=1 Tax=Cryptosporidium muris (strain RN66) TaxID=441375 RepID=B6AG06_CRYMR|nr:uncharacterized protein CMU_000160 [Cryptosporidium muris RN66]EEA07147.1 hypothetical protein, conserved [Cryptosporidium muris RN66]|eukprot:XP_002141496.1 hypothetical protein [Cryptosporidium muris RN66]
MENDLVNIEVYFPDAVILEEQNYADNHLTSKEYEPELKERYSFTDMYNFHYNSGFQNCLAHYVGDVDKEVDKVGFATTRYEKSYSYKNFKLEWDEKNEVLYVVIPSVDSIDHWVMLFLQPLGITNDSLKIDNCCISNNCNFKVRIDDERLLLYPDLLDDIYKFILFQRNLWYFYKHHINHIHNSVTTFDDSTVDHLWQNPDINVYLKKDETDHNFSKGREGCCSEYCDSYLKGQHILPCISTTISESNVFTTDSTIFPLLTSEDSSSNDDYQLNSFTNICNGNNERAFFPIND